MIDQDIDFTTCKQNQPVLLSLFQTGDFISNLHIRSTVKIPANSQFNGILGLVQSTVYLSHCKILIELDGHASNAVGIAQLIDQLYIFDVAFDFRASGDEVFGLTDTVSSDCEIVRLDLTLIAVFALESHGLGRTISNLKIKVSQLIIQQSTSSTDQSSASTFGLAYGTQLVEACYISYSMSGKFTNVAAITNLANQDPVTSVTVRDSVLDLQIRSYNVVGGLVGLVSNKSASSGTITLRNLKMQGAIDCRDALNQPVLSCSQVAGNVNEGAGVRLVLGNISSTVCGPARVSNQQQTDPEVRIDQTGC